MSTAMQKPVTMRALLQRINRKLAKEAKVLKTLRGNRYEHELERYYSVNVERNAIEAMPVDPEQWGRELAVLQAWETLREER